MTERSFNFERTECTCAFLSQARKRIPYLKSKDLNVGINKMKVRQASKMAALAIAIAAAVSLGACSKGGSGPAAGAKQTAARAIPVTVETVEEHPIQVSEQISGRTVAYRVAEVRPQVNGILLKRLFTEGQQVTAGQPLYQIDASTYNASAANARAQLAQAVAQLNLARANAARSAELVKLNAVSKQSDDTAQAAVRTGEATVKAAKAALENANINVRYTTVKAPISGRVSISEVTPGALMTAYQAQRMTVIHQLDPIYVDVQRTNTELLKLRRDVASGRIKKLPDGSAPVKIQLEDGSTYPLTGKLAFQGVSVGENSGTVTLRAVFSNPKGTLLPGMYVRAVLPSGDIPNAITISQHAVMRDMRGDPYVFVVNSEKKVEQRAIKVSDAINDRWVVDSGLKPGEKVIVEGIGKVRAGALVEPSDGAAAPAASAPASSAAASAPAASAPAGSAAASSKAAK